MVEVRKRDGESPESLVRRFTRKVQQSGVLLRAKKGRFYSAPKTKREQRIDALRRKAVKEKKEFLRKTGKLDELEKMQSRRGRGRR